MVDNKETKPTEAVKTTENMDSENSISPTSGEEENPVKLLVGTDQRKRSLRPDSILIRDRMLSDITEEDPPTQISSNSSTSPLATKHRSIRPTSAYYDDQKANGKPTC